MLDRGTTLRDGDLLQADDGRIVKVVSAPEPLMEIRTRDAGQLARAAYHLGNRHAGVEVGVDCLRFGADGVLANLLRGLGFEVAQLFAPFEPEPGAYAAGAHAHAGNARHAGRIHDFVQRDIPHER